LSRLKELEGEMASPSFWQNPQLAGEKASQKAQLEKYLKRWSRLEQKYEEVSLLAEMLKEEQDTALDREIRQGLEALAKELGLLRVEHVLSGPKDINNAIVTIHPGAGGTESQDWAEMLMRMYIRWAERRGYEVRLIDLLPGEEAGIKSVTFSVEGLYAYGYLKCEMGVHRLVRISPFDANKRRHTSFSSVFVLPEVEDDPEIVLNEKDLKLDTYRASSAGGQHVNKTSSAVRITHLPTGIVVSCQNERSQHQNKAMALMVLKAKLYDLKQKEKEEKLSQLSGEKKEITWGSQIRSYVLQPYQLVKDHRTGLEAGNVSAILDGEIDPFIKAFLLRRKVEPKTPGSSSN
jgi:peptide chain release factor 2